MDALCGDASELRDSLLVNRSIRFFKNFRLSCCAGFSLGTSASMHRKITSLKSFLCCLLQHHDWRCEG